MNLKLDTVKFEPELATTCDCYVSGPAADCEFKKNRLRLVPPPRDRDRAVLVTLVTVICY